MSRVGETIRILELYETREEVEPSTSILHYQAMSESILFLLVERTLESMRIVFRALNEMSGRPYFFELTTYWASHKATPREDVLKYCLPDEVILILSWMPTPPTVWYRDEYDLLDVLWPRRSVYSVC